MRGRKIYKDSTSQSLGLDKRFTRAVGAFTDEVERAFGSKKSSTGEITVAGGGGGTRRWWGCSGIWLFLRWSGVCGGDREGEEGARVGDEELEGGGRDAMSKSLSGTVGPTKGRLVMRKSAKRKIALVIRG